MAGAATASSVARIVAAHGETFTLRRFTDDGGDLDVVLKGKRTGVANSAPMVNTANRATLRVMIGNAEILAAGWPGPPRKTDRLIDSTNVHWVVEHCDSRGDSGVVLCHFLTLAGAA